MSSVDAFPPSPRRVCVAPRTGHVVGAHYESGDERISSCRRFWLFTQNHQLFAVQRRHRVSTTFGIRKFHLKMISAEKHDDGSDLATSQLEWLMRDEMRCRDIFRERDQVVHLNVVRHS